MAALWLRITQKCTHGNGGDGNNPQADDCRAQRWLSASYKVALLSEDQNVDQYRRVEGQDADHAVELLLDPR